MEKEGLKYPVLLVHGMGFRDNKLINYWGRIPKTLEREGCRIYYGTQDSNGSVETNGETVAKRIAEILEEEKTDKVNIIAHSKGGLDARYAMSTLGMGKSVASLTTISTPHNGSRTMDAVMGFPKWALKAGSFVADLWFRILGDKRPATYKVLELFSTEGARRFNESNPDCEGVFYQSYAFAMKRASSDIFMLASNLFVSVFDGENDGLLPPAAVKWGEFRGTFYGAGRRGISHCDEVDMRRRPLSKKAGDGVSDITDIYREIAIALEKKGF